MSSESSGVPPTLNADQYQRWASSPDVPRRAVEAVMAELGALAPVEDMLAVAAHGTLEAAATYDPQRGGTYGDWAFVYATLRVWEWLRRAHGKDPKALARIRAAMFGFLANEHGAVDPWATRATSSQTLKGFSDGLLMAGHLVLGGETISGRGEPDLVEIEAAIHAGDALRQVTARLTPEQRHLLERCHAYGETVKAAAREGGRGYRAVLREYHDLLAQMGEQLGRMGIKEYPPWRGAVSGEVFDAPATPANDEERGG